MFDQFQIRPVPFRLRRDVHTEYAVLTQTLDTRALGGGPHTHREPQFSPRMQGVDEMIDHTRMLSQGAKGKRHKIPLMQADIGVEKVNGRTA